MIDRQDGFPKTNQGERNALIGPKLAPAAPVQLTRANIQLSVFYSLMADRWLWQA